MDQQIAKKSLDIVGRCNYNLAYCSIYLVAVFFGRAYRFKGNATKQWLHPPPRRISRVGSGENSAIVFVTRGLKL